MILTITEYVIVLIALISLGVFLTTGFKRTLMLYATVPLYVGYLLVRYFFFPHHTMTSVFRCVTPFLLVPAMMYHILVLEKEENPSERYFGILYLGQLFWIFFLISFFTKGLRPDPDNVFILPNLLLIPFTLVCRKSTTKHQTFFIIFGITTMLLWLGAYILHPVVAGAVVTPQSLMTSLRLNIAFFIFPILFFLGNWAKLGLFDNPSVHRKVFSYLIAMFAVSMFARQPELTPFLDRIPFLGDKLSDASALGLFVVPPLLGFIFSRRSKKVGKGKT